MYIRNAATNVYGASPLSNLIREMSGCGRDFGSPNPELGTQSPPIS